MVYDNTLTSIVDDLLPPRRVRTRNSPLTPRFDGECRAMRRKVRKAERLFRRTLLDNDRRAWIGALREKHVCFREKERRYWEDRIASRLTVGPWCFFSTRDIPLRHSLSVFYQTSIRPWIRAGLHYWLFLT